MPIYDYRCCECGEEEELMFNMSTHDKHSKDQDLPKCKNCPDGLMLSQVNKGTSFVLKGNGDWASNSYGK